MQRLLAIKLKIIYMSKVMKGEENQIKKLKEMKESYKGSFICNWVRPRSVLLFHCLSVA